MNALRHSSRVLDFSEYQGALTESVYPIRLDLPGSAAAFRATLGLAHVGAMDMVFARADSAFHCTQQAAQRSAAQSRLILKMQLSGETSYQHVGRHLHCSAGDIALLSDTDIIEGEQHGAAEALVVRLPFAQIRSLAPRVLGGIGHVIPTQDATGRILAMTLREVWNLAGQQDVRAHSSMLASLLHLIDASINGCLGEDEGEDEGGPSARRDERFARLQDLVAQRCSEADLTIDALARALAVSRSTMYETARAAGTTVERMVMDARVKRAIAVLGDPAQAGTPITMLAYDLGFKHPSHLSRVFQAATGATPLEFRRNAIDALKERNTLAN